MYPLVIILGAKCHIGLLESTACKTRKLASGSQSKVCWCVMKKKLMIVCGFSITSPQGNAPVLVLDCNKDFVTDGEQREKLMVKVEQFLFFYTYHQLQNPCCNPARSITLRASYGKATDYHQFLLQSTYFTLRSTSQFSCFTCSWFK